MKIPESHVNGGNIYRLSDNLSFKVAAIAEPLAAVFTGIEVCMVKRLAMITIHAFAF